MRCANQLFRTCPVSDVWVPLLAEAPGVDPGCSQLLSVPRWSDLHVEAKRIPRRHWSLCTTATLFIFQLPIPLLSVIISNFLHFPPLTILYPCMSLLHYHGKSPKDWHNCGVLLSSTDSRRKPSLAICHKSIFTYTGHIHCTKMRTRCTQRMHWRR